MPYTCVWIERLRLVLLAFRGFLSLCHQGATACRVGGVAGWSLAVCHTKARRRVDPRGTRGGGQRAGAVGVRARVAAQRCLRYRASAAHLC
jgi:hypothetical protein